MNWETIFKAYTNRNKNCFSSNRWVKFNQKYGNYVQHEYNLFKTEIREISLDTVFEYYQQTKNKLDKIHKEVLTFEEFLNIFKDMERKNLDKIIEYRVV